MKRIGDFTVKGKHEYMEGRKRISPARIIPVSFLLAILIGTFLLMLPVSSATGESQGLVTALFTATTSVCVTGLVVVDTYAAWSLFGKIVILILIQLGGLGIISFTSMVMILLRKRFSIEDRQLLVDAMNFDTGNGLLRFLMRIFRWTFAVEGFGACLYLFEFIPRYGVIKGIWVSVFTAISAFCNAGIDIMGPDSLISYNTNPGMLCITMLMIILGGLGYVVWFDVTDVAREGIKDRFTPAQSFSRLSAHTKLVLVLTVSLIFAGAVVIFPAEYNNPATMGDMTLGNKILNSFFQSVTYRTAGFAAVPQDGLSPISVLVGYFLMFIGGSPIGTAGGVKTVTMFIVALNVVAFIRQRNETVVFKREIAPDLMRKAIAIVSVSLSAVLVMTILLLATNDTNMEDALFEIFSAIATVGLSRGLTPNLTIFGKLIVIISMYLGRIGPISLAIFFAGKKSGQNRLDYAKGKFYVG